MSGIFINYRRNDSLAATRGLAEQLKEVFGPSRVFIDITSITPSQDWRRRIERTLKDSKVLLVIIGPNWLTASDKYGRRRLDKDGDWVREEIEIAIKHKLNIIPTLVGGAELPIDKALPKSLLPLLNKQVHQMPDAAWDAKFKELVNLLENNFGLIPNQRPVEYPNPRVKIKPLEPKKLAAHLEKLSGWELVESTIPGDYPNARSELRKIYQFKSFPEAIEFMKTAIPTIEANDPYPHHPRWENIWKTVTVWLTTWDIGHMVSNLDVRLAKKLDKIYALFEP